MKVTSTTVWMIVIIAAFIIFFLLYSTELSANFKSLLGIANDTAENISQFAP